ncbi:uncharacterized protein LOC121423494 [Lytechinus variegatus]|uniref:uncharacterized protein LOC121423494 n=1 Tax=Lytechinus variegatus TaxID=7654 RepID=UPI001BB18CB2|nr:uncharacterized protein LOC121423494 [Lytechinus variegatus]
MLSCVCDELGGEVPSSVKEKIWKGEFVELGGLLKGKHRAVDICVPYLRVYILGATLYACARAPQVYRYRSFYCAFWDFNWRAYDIQFRLRQARHPHRSWAVIDTELWLTVASTPGRAMFSSFGGNQPFRTYDRSFRLGYNVNGAWFVTRFG